VRADARREQDSVGGGREASHGEKGPQQHCRGSASFGGGVTCVADGSGERGFSCCTLEAVGA
jgi:hypothetical protein